MLTVTDLFVWIGGAFVAGAAVAAIVAWLFCNDLLKERQEIVADTRAASRRSGAAHRVIVQLIKLADRASLGNGITARVIAANWDPQLREMPYTLQLGMPRLPMNVGGPVSTSDPRGGEQ